MVSYFQRGRMWHVFVSGAVNARSPNPVVPQVHFKKDYSGGRGKWTSLQEHVPARTTGRSSRGF